MPLNSSIAQQVFKHGEHTPETREKSPTFYLKVLISPEETETPVSVNRKHMANSSTPTLLCEYI